MNSNGLQSIGLPILILSLFSVPLRGQVEIPSASPREMTESLFENSRESLVDYNGYFKPARDGLWQDKPFTSDIADEVKAEPSPVYTPRKWDLPSHLKLRIGFDALLWERSAPEDTVFATEDNGGQWSFGDFDLTKGDARYVIQYMGDDDTGYELLFFDFNSFSSTLDADGLNVRPQFFGALPAILGNSYDLVYVSRLKSVEINSWVRHDECKRSAFGIRHLNLDETFNVQTGATSGLFSRTDNDLWGMTRSWERRRKILNTLDLVGGLNLGLFLNRSKLNVDTQNVDDFSEDKSVAGNLGFNIGIRYRVANHVTFRIGYEGLALFGVALASTQSLNQQILNGLNDPEYGSVYFGGINLGVVATF